MMRHAAVRTLLRSGLVAAALRQRWGSQERMMMSGMGERPRWVALWGNGDYGRLGQASGESRWIPTICMSMHNLQPVALACGGAHTLVLTGLAFHLFPILPFTCVEQVLGTCNCGQNVFGGLRFGLFNLIHKSTAG